MMHSLVFPYLNFALFLLILYFVARKPSKAYAQKQKEDFISLRLKAQEAESLAQEKLLKLEKRQSQFQEEILRLRKAVEKESAKELEKLQDKSNSLVAYLAGESERLSNQQLESAAQGLQKKIWDQGVKLCKEKIGRFDKEQHIKLLSQQITSLEGFVVAKGSHQDARPLRKEL